MLGVLPPRGTTFLKVKDGATLTLPWCGTMDAALQVPGPEVCAVFEQTIPINRRLQEMPKSPTFIPSVGLGHSSNGSIALSYVI